MDEPVRHVTYHPSDVRKMRAMSARDSIALACGLTDTVLALQRAGGSRRPRFWRPAPSKRS